MKRYHSVDITRVVTLEFAQFSLWQERQTCRKYFSCLKRKTEEMKCYHTSVTTTGRDIVTL